MPFFLLILLRFFYCQFTNCWGIKYPETNTLLLKLKHSFLALWKLARHQARSSGKNAARSCKQVSLPWLRCCQYAFISRHFAFYRQPVEVGRFLAENKQNYGIKRQCWGELRPPKCYFMRNDQERAKESQVIYKLQYQPIQEKWANYGIMRIITLFSSN